VLASILSACLLDEKCIRLCSFAVLYAGRITERRTWLQAFAITVVVRGSFFLNNRQLPHVRVLMSHVFHDMILNIECNYHYGGLWSMWTCHLIEVCLPSAALWEIRLAFTYCGDVYDAPYPENGVIVHFWGPQGQVSGSRIYVSSSWHAFPRKYRFQKFHLDQSWGLELQEADMASILIHLVKMFVAWYGQS